MSIPTDFETVNKGNFGMNFVLTKNFGNSSFDFFFADFGRRINIEKDGQIEEQLPTYILTVESTNMSFKNASTFEVITQTSFNPFSVTQMQNALVAQTAFIQINNGTLSFGFTNLVPELASMQNPIFENIDRVNITNTPTIGMSLTAITIQNGLSQAQVFGIIFGIIGGIILLCIIIIAIYYGIKK